MICNLGVIQELEIFCALGANHLTYSSTVVVVFLVMVVVIPQVYSFTLRFLVMPLHFCLEMRMLTGFSVFMSLNSVFVVSALITKLPCLLFRHFTIFIILTMSMSMVVASSRI